MLPIRTSVSPGRTPYVNYALIALNVVLFLMSMTTAIDPQTRQRIAALRPWAEHFMLTPDKPYIWQFVTYAFLHSGMMHIFGNMYFLYMFGNNVNDKLGHVGYLCFYLAGAVFSGLGHALLHVNPVLGASGAVAAVTGAYLVLYPKSVITVLYWFIFIGTIELSALVFIGFKLIVWDNIIERHFSPASIAYEAHLAGYAFGVVVVLLLLSVKLIEGNYMDMWSILRQWNRRRRFRDVVAGGYDPYKGTGGGKAAGVSRTDENQPGPEDESITRTKTQIAALIQRHNLTEAAKLYIELVKYNPEKVLSRQYQLDVANQLMAMGDWTHSAAAYEKYLKHYSSYDYSEQVELMLGILYSRYLDRHDEAIKYLTLAKDKLSDSGQKEMCLHELEKLHG